VASYLQGFALPLEDQIAVFHHLNARWPGDGRIAIQIAPSNLHWLSDAALDAAARLHAATGAPMHMHLLETPYQKEYARQRTGGSALDFIDQFGLVSPQLTIGHGVWMTDDDLALLELEPEPEDSLPALELAEKNAATGDEVMVIGNPMQLPRLPGEGKVIGFQELQGEGKDERDYPCDHPAVMALQASIHRGSSGSPVFDENHRVIGVIYATARQEEQEETIGLAVTVSALRRFLEDSGQELSF